MKLRIIMKQGGGIFSYFYLAISNIALEIKDIDLIESIYIEPHPDSSIGKICKEFNPFNFVLEQKIENFDCEIETCITEMPYILNTFDKTHLSRLKRICSKIRIKEEITNSVNPEITEKTLGVHIRLTDMLQYHPQYISDSGSTTESYMDKAGELVQQNDPIFVTSDNKQSIIKFKERFNVISNNSRNLSDVEDSKNYYEYQLDNLDKEWFWYDSFLDMISLSKCGSLIYNVSSLNTIGFLYSNSITNTYRLGH